MYVPPPRLAICIPSQTREVPVSQARSPGPEVRYPPMAEEPTEGAQYITVGEAAQLLGVHRNTVRNRIKDGRIKAHKVIEGEREFYRIDANSLDVGRTSADVHNKVAQRTADGGNVVQMLVHRIDTAIEEVGELRERLGEERGRHIRVEEENERLRQELEALRASRQSSESQSATPTDTAVGS